MRRSSVGTGLLVVLLGTACVGPTEKEINDSLDAQLRSVAGDWTSVATGQNPVRLEFRLQEGAGGQVSGTGTAKEENAAAPVPITVSGTYQRPALSLTFDGIVYEGQSVQGAIQGSYTSVGGVSTTLRLTRPGWSRDIPILLQEK
ncbi:MAG: hypothetical protein KY467_17345 [Gemmatimonadetes bacterium]|nr:hypothetical protein [Gemmatimonadota bacterium]